MDELRDVQRMIFKQRKSVMLFQIFKGNDEDAIWRVLPIEYGIK